MLICKLSYRQLSKYYDRKSKPSVKPFDAKRPVYRPPGSLVPDPSSQSTSRHMYLFWSFIQGAQVASGCSASKGLKPLLANVLNLYCPWMGKRPDLYQSAIWNFSSCLSYPILIYFFQMRVCRTQHAVTQRCRCFHTRAQTVTPEAYRSSMYIVIYIGVLYWLWQELANHLSACRKKMIHEELVMSDVIKVSASWF